MGTKFRSNTIIKNIYDIRFFTGVTSLDSQAFQGTSNLGDIILPNNIKSVGSSTFSGSGLTSCVIEAGGITGLSASMFNGCAKQTSVTIPEGVTTIGSYCFRHPSNGAAYNSLHEITYPSTITTMGDEIHLYSALSTFIILATVPPSLGVRMFNYGSVPNIYVPDESVNAYKTAANWSSFASKIKPISEFTE